MLAVVPVPGVVGFNPSATNVASAKNSGIELEVSYKNFDNPMNYSLGGNISFIKNEVTGLGEGGQPISSGNVFGAGDFVSYTEIGMPIAYFYGYETGGIFQTNEEADANISQPNAQAGDVIFVDQNLDGTIDGDDKVMIGNPHPDFTYGINLTAGFKGFDLSAFFQGTQGNEIYNTLAIYTDFPTFFSLNRSTRVLDSWSSTNTGAEMPALSENVTNSETNPNSYFVEDGSYFRLKNLQLGYNIPSSALSKLGMSAARIYVQGTNLFTSTKYNGADPEIQESGSLTLGVDYGKYPLAKVVTVGLKFNF